MQVLVFKDFQDWRSRNSNKHQIIEKLDLYLQKVRRMTTDEELGVRTYNAGCVMEIRLATEGGHIRLYCDTAATKMTPPILKIAGISQKSITKHGQREDILYARAIIEDPTIQWVEYLSDISVDMPLSMDFCQQSPEKDESATPRVKKEKKIKKPKKQKVISQEPEPIMKNKQKKQKKTQVVSQTSKQSDGHTVTALLPNLVPFSPDIAEQILKEINLSRSPAEELALQILRTPYREQPTDIYDDVVADDVHNTIVDPQDAVNMVKKAVTDIQAAAQPIDVVDNTVPTTDTVTDISDTSIIEQKQDQETMFTEYDDAHYELEILTHKMKIQDAKIAIANYQIELQNAQIEKEMLEIKRLQILQQQKQPIR